MSPEQARGRDVDKRTDIWAFGCLLYELLTGKRAFPGETLQDTIASVLEREPDWQALPAKTPTQVRELLRQCLQKDPARRLNNIADARRTIEKAQRGWNRWRVTAIAAAALAMLAIGAALWLRNATHLPGPLAVATTNQSSRFGHPASAFAGWPDAGVYSRLFHVFWAWPGLREDTSQWRARTTDARQPHENESGIFTGWRAHRIYRGGPAVSLGHLGGSHARRRAATMAA